MRFTNLLLSTALLLTCLIFQLEAKSWRGIVPLKSSRAEVEKLLGTANDLGRYQFDDERAYVFYSQGNCDNRAGKCACLIPPDTVVAIHVVLEVSLKFSELKIDKSRYEKQRIHPGSNAFSYSNFSEGVVYDVDESKDEIIGIDYLPAAVDCEALVREKQSKRLNVWQTLSPLYSNRDDVKRLLGAAPMISGSRHLYSRSGETIVIRYVKERCGPGMKWDVAADTVEEIEVIPLTRVGLNELRIDLTSYDRIESKHPEKIFKYESVNDGLLIQTRLVGNTEDVFSIKYGPSRQDFQLRCR